MNVNDLDLCIIYIGKGFSYYYNHITPHIGFTAKPRFLSIKELESRRAPDPQYCYESESNKIVNRLRRTANDDFRKMIIEWADEKIDVVGAIVVNLDVILSWTYSESSVIFIKRLYLAI